MSSEAKVGLMRRVLLLLGLESPSRAIEKAVQRADDVEEHLKKIEQVTTAWDFSENDRREMAARDE